MLTPLPCSRDACGFRKIFKVRAGGERAKPPEAYHSSRIPSPPADYSYLHDSLNACAPHAARQRDMLNQFAPLNGFATSALRRTLKVLPAPVAWSVGC